MDMSSIPLHLVQDHYQVHTVSHIDGTHVSGTAVGKIAGVAKKAKVVGDDGIRDKRSGTTGCRKSERASRSEYVPGWSRIHCTRFSRFSRYCTRLAILRRGWQ